MSATKSDLEKYYLIKQRNFFEIEQNFKKTAAIENAVISCRKKCWYCCVGYIVSPEIEINLICYFIEKSSFLKLIDTFSNDLKSSNNEIKEILEKNGLC